MTVGEFFALATCYAESTGWNRPNADIRQQRFKQIFQVLARLKTLMKITPSERATLLGPTVIGMLVGAFSAFCVVAFDSDYGGTIQVWQRVLRTVLGFFGGFLVAFGPFGLLPILVARLVRRNRSG